MKLINLHSKRHITAYLYSHGIQNAAIEKKKIFQNMFWQGANKIGCWAY